MHEQKNAPFKQKKETPTFVSKIIEGQTFQMKCPIKPSQIHLFLSPNCFRYQFVFKRIFPRKENKNETTRATKIRENLGKFCFFLVENSRRSQGEALGPKKGVHTFCFQFLTSEDQSLLFSGNTSFILYVGLDVLMVSVTS